MRDTVEHRVLYGSPAIHAAGEGARWWLLSSKQERGRRANRVQALHMLCIALRSSFLSSDHFRRRRSTRRMPFAVPGFSLAQRLALSSSTSSSVTREMALSPRAGRMWRRNPSQYRPGVLALMSVALVRSNVSAASLTDVCLALGASWPPSKASRLFRSHSYAPRRVCTGEVIRMDSTRPSGCRQRNCTTHELRTTGLPFVSSLGVPSRCLSPHFRSCTLTGPQANRSSVSRM
jgi:hypothetical protein